MPRQMHRFTTPSTLAALALLWGGCQPEPGSPEQAERLAAPKSVYGNRIEVKLADGSGATIRDGQLVSRYGVDLSTAAALFRRAAAEPLIRLPLSILDQWHDECLRRVQDGRDAPPHLGLWFRLTLDNEIAATTLLRELQLCPVVDTAYLEMIPYAAVPWGADRQDADNEFRDRPPETPDLTGEQAYLSATPDGLNSWYAHGFVGGRGRGVRVRHIEEDWVLDHEDTSQLIATALVANPQTPGTVTARYHGLASAGIVVADRNRYGITGMADRVELTLYSVLTDAGLPNVIAQAIDDGTEGDVIMMILQLFLGQRGSEDLVPVEFVQSHFDAILTATTLGRHFVENAANGANDLDDPRFLRRFDQGFRDSGAILVGASEGLQLQRADFSNFGSRLTCSAWGRNVTTTGYGDLFGPFDPQQAYTATYSGTSSATPMVTAAVASLLATAKWQLGVNLEVDEVRQLLREHGTVIPDGIGKRPDLAAMFRALGIEDGLAVDGHPVGLGESRAVQMSGTPGNSFALLASFNLARTDLGLNRDAHLDFGSLLNAGWFELDGGRAEWTLQVPEEPFLRGVDLFFQGVSIDPESLDLHLTNSVQVTVR